jgi:cation diffusion facilitator family transporter
MAPTGFGRAERAALAALGLTVALSAAKVGVYLGTSSLAVLSQALDSILDIVALALVFLGVRVATKPADREHQYGHAKAENLVAFVQTLILGVIVVAVAIEAVRRLSGDAEPVSTPWYGFALLGASVVIDVFRVRMLSSAARAERSDALRAGALNFATDIGTALVALVSIAFVALGFERADAIGSLVVAVAVAIATARLGKRSVDVLMDRAPSVGIEAISRAAARAPGVAETRRVRVRSSGSQVFTDVTVAAGRTSSLERAHDIAENVETAIRDVAPGADVVVHVEPTSETAELTERVLAAAGRAAGVYEVHNVLVHAFDADGVSKLHVTLHAKVNPGTVLEEAHEISDRIEAAVAGELGSDVRVDTHIEPLVLTGAAHDVTAQRPELVDEIKRLARAEPDVGDCHEVLVASSPEGLTIVAHVTGMRDLPLSRIHDASQRIEKAIHARHEEIGPVVIHFEPM